MKSKRPSLSQKQLDDWLNEEIGSTGMSRRSFLKVSGFFAFGFSTAALIKPAELAAAPFVETVDPTKLDSWLTIAQNGRVTLFFGKVDNGQGVSTAIRQLVSDELDVPYDKIDVVVGDTARTVDQGGATGSSGISRGSPPVRNACAEARHILLELAAKRFGVAVEQLLARDGVISVRETPSKQISYGELIGDQRLNTALTWNKEFGGTLRVESKNKTKSAKELKIVGQPVPREDVPAIVFGQEHYVADVRLPGMVHARAVRPRIAGSKLVDVDESSVRNVPGFIKVVMKGDYVAVVCAREEHAIKAARLLKVNWSQPTEAPFPTDSDGLYDYIRQATPAVGNVVPANRLGGEPEGAGNVEEALAAADRVIEAVYEWPYQAHASFSPACAVADWRDDELTVWSATQKPYYSREGIAALLSLPKEKVRVIWKPGPGSYGRNDAGDVALEAAFLAKEVGRPVRLQWMRNEGTGWDPKGPAAVMRMRGGFDSKGSVIAYEFEARGFSQRDVAPWEFPPGEALIGQLLGFKREVRNTVGTPGESYTFPNKRKITHTIPPLLAVGSPLRGSHLRLPSGPSTSFASESFIDELAYAAKTDPVEFRMRYISDQRQLAALKGAVDAAGWQSRPSPKPGAEKAKTGIVSGRGIAVREQIATIAEVEVNLETGKVRIKRFVCAHECGLIVNPDGLTNVVEGNLLHSMSRALYEEVKFDRSNVTSTDWRTYPIATIDDVPDKIDVVLINRPDLGPLGAGEQASAQTAAAIANAIFDATGVRLRRVPFTAKRVKAALDARS